MSTKQRKRSGSKKPRLLRGEKADIYEEVATVIADAPQWFEMPHPLLGGQKPRQLVGTPQEELIRDLVRAIKQGMPT